MADEIKDERIAEIEARAEVATPRPWCWESVEQLAWEDGP